MPNSPGVRSSDRSRRANGRAATSAPAAGRPATLWSIDDLAEYLGVPVHTIYKWRQTGEGPVGYKIGKYLRFDPEDVYRWLATRREDATDLQ
jgi:excisionase family DNA binding protein